MPRSSNHSNDSLHKSPSGNSVKDATDGMLSKKLANSTITVLKEESESPLAKHKTISGGDTPKNKFFNYFSKRATSKSNLSTSIDFQAHKKAESRIKEPPKTNSLGSAPKTVHASAFEIRASESAPPKALTDYYIIRRVGKGGFATVFLIRLKSSTGRYYALKAIKKQEIVRLKQEKQIMNEKLILSELKHPLLVDMYQTFQSPSNLFFIMEYVAGGDLFTLLRRSKVC
jgi:hypothetical protein